jgi:hypothetical protein
VQRETSGNCETFSNSESFTSFHQQSAPRSSESSEEIDHSTLITTPTRSTSSRRTVIPTSSKVTKNNIHNKSDAAKESVDANKAKCNATATVPEHLIYNIYRLLFFFTTG